MTMQTQMKILKRLVKLFFHFALAGIVIIALLLFSFWIELKCNITLPEPTGQYQVGRIALHLTDTSRLDSLSPPPYAKRELIVWIWYPASVSSTDSGVRYDHAEWASKADITPNLLFRTFFARNGQKIHAHSFQNPKLSEMIPKYPVLLMKSGIGTLSTDYTAMAEDLASHGYIVVGSDAPYSTYKVIFPDGRIILKTGEGNPGEAEYYSDTRVRTLHRILGIWTDDTRFVLDQIEQMNRDSSSKFFNRFDINTVGVFGHSFGGATAAQFCYDDPRCKAGIDMDGAPYGSVIQKGIHKPFMFLLADHVADTDRVSMNIKSNVRSIHNSNQEDHYWFYLTGAEHFNFCDMPYQKEYLVMRLFGGTGSVGRRHATEVIRSTVLGFFDTYLKNNPKIKFDELINTTFGLKSPAK
jgi:predicted dienelactone hydrolase